MLIDQFNRHVSYLRLSVTDRCDFRCIYCMSEDMTFLPRTSILSLEELYEIASAFVELGGRKIRLTGGEPLIRRGVESLITRIGSLPQLEHLAITTNGSQLSRQAQQLKASGVDSLNISLDSLKSDRFKELTRTGDLDQVVAGIVEAKRLGIPKIRLNSVIIKGKNDDEILDLIDFALAQGIDIAFIEEMPLGEMPDVDRAQRWLSNQELRQRVEQHLTLIDEIQDSSAAGPARYAKIQGTATRIGFISPHSHNFCGDCNRIRVTVEGRLLLCLGNEHSVDLRSILRAPDYHRDQLLQAFKDAMQIKPEKHHFLDPSEPQILRFMNATGG